jgi:glycerol-3-phosphate dehydrogenase subunit C
MITLLSDHCIKCNICTMACPVAGVNDAFPGPKAAGPQAERFRGDSLPADNLAALCSGCGICSYVCPHDVPVAELNTRAKAKLAQTTRTPLRDKLIARPDRLGRVGVPFSRLANLVLGDTFFRSLIEVLLKIDTKAPLPKFARKTFQRIMRPRRRNQSAHSQRVVSKRVPTREREKTVFYFHGCSTNYYEPHIGELTVAVLEKLGYRVIVGSQGCCGLPLQSTGQFDEARKQAIKQIQQLGPYASQHVPIIGTSTSCTLMLKHEYRAVLGLETPETEAFTETVHDVFAFLWFNEREQLKGVLQEISEKRAFYHAPCQLRGHGVGTPALHVLRMIPGFQVMASQALCCGVAGTYGVKTETYATAMGVGGPLFAEARAAEADFVLSDSETCRWWIDAQVKKPVYHPIEILAQALGVNQG